ncbi:MAG: LPXTG cell wall anchor domain-containing protein [Bacteroidales bacterium]|nr:LPXTG cell wall anchor domain-containing protein [Bacteroidales bacterium]
MKKAGIIIFIVGVALTVFTTFQFFTKEKVADLGVVEVTREKPHSISWSPLIGIAVMGIGGVLLWKGSKK